jgi:SWI/SNF-related matrix-associated actin-dependent regulator of chromatin subfamily B member 1
LPSIYSARRTPDQVRTYTPQLNFYAENDLERNERADRRKRRQPRGRRSDKIVLPDREPLKTFRTPAVGFPEPEKETIVPVAPSRRAAAIAAEKANTQIAVIEQKESQPYSSSPTMSTTMFPSAPQTHIMPSMNNRPSQPPTQPVVDAAPKRSRQELLRGPPVAARARQSRPLPPTTMANPDTKVPAEWIRSARERAATKPTGKRRGPKERELPEGQHPNVIDGVWHCSNCGCPEDVAVGRRQGPLGPKSMCGQCGKWWHRHRKPLEVEYSTNREFHLEKKRKDDEIRRLKKRGGMKAVQAAQERDRLLAQSTPSGNGAHGSPLFTSVPRPISATTPRKNRPPPSNILNSSESSLSPPAMSPPRPRKRELGPPASTHREPGPPNSAPRESAQPVQQGQLPPLATLAPPPPDLIAEILAAPPPTVRTNYSSTPTDRNRAAAAQRPAWLNEELAKLRTRYPEDIFDVLQKAKPPVNGEPAPNPAAASEWRVRCSDCPGKVCLAILRDWISLLIHAYSFTILVQAKLSTISRST